MPNGNVFFILQHRFCDLWKVLCGSERKGVCDMVFFQPSPELVPAIQVFLDLNLNVFTSPELSPANRYTALSAIMKVHLCW